MNLADVTDLILRGGILSLCMLTAFQLATLRPTRTVSRIGILFVASTAIYTIKGIPGLEPAIGLPAFLAIQFPGFILVAFFWMFVRALVLDNYRVGWLDGAVLAFNVATFVPICVMVTSLSSPTKMAHLIVSLILIADTLRVTLLTRKDDLVESRRGVTKAMVCIIPAIGFVIASFVVLETMQLTETVAPVLQSGIIFATILVFTASISTLHDSLVAIPMSVAKPVVDTTLAPADRLELVRLRSLMEHGVFLEPNLTIGSLAAKMKMPEHRLRKLINNHLGHRNFAGFINDQRIEEAKKRLGDGNLAREQITGLAFDLGFASLAPFNRAFRERVGMSPSEFRTKALTLAIANHDHPLHS